LNQQLQILNNTTKSILKTVVSLIFCSDKYLPLNVGEEDDIVMERLKILAKDDSPQFRGQLIEKLSTEVLNYYGYRSEKILKAAQNGIKIDIKGKHTVTGFPFYAECNCCEAFVTESEIQAFYGKYMVQWHKNNSCHGVLIAFPGLDQAAEKFYRRHIEENPDLTAPLYQEDEILRAVIASPEVADPETIAGRIAPKVGKPGDWLLLYTGKGLFWVQYVVRPDKRDARRVVLLNAGGNPISDPSTLDYLTVLYPVLEDCDNVAAGSAVALQAGLFQNAEEIAELSGSSEFFEYQFPASPQHFVGRQPYLEKLEVFAEKVVNKRTLSRGMVLEAPSGQGKSSLVLAGVDRFRKMGHFALALDSRCVSSSRFVLHAVNYALRQFGAFGGLMPSADLAKPFAEVEDALNALLEVGRALESHGKLVIVFFDQFENVFFQADTLKHFKDMHLKLSNAQTNVVLGFSLKSDLGGAREAFDYELLKPITASSDHMVLDVFSKAEVNDFLEKLKEKLCETLRKDLWFYLAEFSQGYPWLMKKLCARVIDLRQAGVPQADIARRLLNIKVLLNNDLNGLSDEAEAVLRRIAKAAPIRVSQAGAGHDPGVIQSLIRQGLVINIGTAWDIYGDIFRDFLAADTVPARDNYILSAKAKDVFLATRILQKANGCLDTSEFMVQAALSAKSFVCVARDMSLLELAHVDQKKIILQIELPENAQDFEVLWRNHVQSKLQGNRLARRLLKTLKNKKLLTIEELSRLLEDSCPYLSFPKQTLLKYTRIFAQWLNAADLARIDNKNLTLTYFDPETEIRERQLVLPKRRGTKTPQIQYAPVEDIAIRLWQALQRDGGVDWTGQKKSTIFRALATLEDFGFIQRSTQLIKVLPKCFEFVSHPKRRSSLFAEGALKLESFSKFIEILHAHKDNGNTLLALGLELRENLGTSWKESTAKKIAKILLDWARHTKLAPGVFARARRGPLRGWKKKEDGQIPLF